MRSARSPILGNPGRLKDYPTRTGKKNPEPARPPTTRRGTTWRKGVIIVTMRTLEQPITSYTRSYLFKAEWLLISTVKVQSPHKRGNIQMDFSGNFISY